MIDDEMTSELESAKAELLIVRRELRLIEAEKSRLLEDNRELSESLLEQSRSSGGSSVLTERLTQLRTQIRDVEKARDIAEEDAYALRGELSDCQDRLKKAESADQSQEIASLQRELEQVHEQFRGETEKMRAQIDELRQANESLMPETLDSDSVVEMESLRQEVESLRSSLEDRLSELEDSHDVARRLEDDLEDAHSSIDELQQKLESSRDEKDELEHKLRNVPAIEDKPAEIFHISDVAPVVVQDHSVAGGGVSREREPEKPARRIGLPLVLGGLMMLLVLDGLAVLSGKGELVSGLVSALKQKYELPSLPEVKRAPNPPAVTGSIQRN